MSFWVKLASFFALPPARRKAGWGVRDSVTAISSIFCFALSLSPAPVVTARTCCFVAIPLEQKIGGRSAGPSVPSRPDPSAPAPRTPGIRNSFYSKKGTFSLNFRCSGKTGFVPVFSYGVPHRRGGAGFYGHLSERLLSRFFPEGRILQLLYRMLCWTVLLIQDLAIPLCAGPLQWNGGSLFYGVPSVPSPYRPPWGSRLCLNRQ